MKQKILKGVTFLTVMSFFITTYAPHGVDDSNKKH